MGLWEIHEGGVRRLMTAIDHCLLEVMTRTLLMAAVMMITGHIEMCSSDVQTSSMCRRKRSTSFEVG